MAEALAGWACDFAGELLVELSGTRQGAELRAQCAIGSPEVPQFEIQRRAGDIRRKLAGEEISRQASHRYEEDDRQAADENVSDDQAIAQPPQQPLTQPPHAHQQPKAAEQK